MPALNNLYKDTRMRQSCIEFNALFRTLYKVFKVGMYFSLKSKCKKLFKLGITTED